MLSSSPTLARPVRTPAMSRRTRSSAASIFVFTSPNMPCKSLKSIALQERLRNSCADRFTHDDAADVSGLSQVEDDDRHLVVHAQRDGSRVHHLQPPLEHLQVGDGRKLRRVWI